MAYLAASFRVRETRTLKARSIDRPLNRARTFSSVSFHYKFPIYRKTRILLLAHADASSSMGPVTSQVAKCRPSRQVANLAADSQEKKEIRTHLFSTVRPLFPRAIQLDHSAGKPSASSIFRLIHCGNRASYRQRPSRIDSVRRIRESLECTWHASARECHSRVGQSA